MKKVLLVFLLLVICLCLSFPFANKNSSPFVSDTGQIEIISDDNKSKIGKEVLNENGPEVVDKEWIYASDDVNNSESFAVNIQIPQNPFYSSVASSLCLPGNSVQEIVTCDNVVPEIIIPNGAVGVFSKGDSSGWLCNAGSILSWSFEKYPMENGTHQTLGVGYIKDGVMHEMQTYRDSLDGEYNFIVPEDGTYFIYVIALSSDPISLKGSDIQIS